MTANVHPIFARAFNRMKGFVEGNAQPAEQLSWLDRMDGLGVLEEDLQDQNESMKGRDE